MGQILRPGQVECGDCKGTGARYPECHVCRGERTVRWRRAVALGWKKEWLENLDPDDPYCDCPASLCCGDWCEFCMGDGVVDAEVADQQITRALVFGVTGHIPPIITRDHYGRIRRRDAYLSTSARDAMIERGLARYSCSMLGDDFWLTDAGKLAADGAVAAWSRMNDSMIAPHDDDGRWEGEGGR